PLVAGGQRLNLFRSLQAREAHLDGELPLLDSVAVVRVTLGEVPRQFAQGTAPGIGPEIVLVPRQGLEDPDGLLGFHIPDLEEGLEFLRLHRSPLSGFALAEIISWPRGRFVPARRTGKPPVR